MAKAYCIKDVSFYKKNNYYDIFIEFENSYWIYGNSEIYLEQFYKETDYTPLGRQKFNEFFCELRESRRKKLKKIYDNKD